jgi:Flp pilus assembly protein TadG
MANGFMNRLWKARTQQDARRGATAVEMALLTPVFFMLFMGAIELGLIEAGQQLMENAAYNTSRLAKTGFVTNGESQAQTVSQEMVNELQSFGNFFDTTKVTMTSVAYNTFASIGTGGAAGLGIPTQIVVYTINYPWPFFTPMIASILGTKGVINLTARIVVRNEPF